LDKDEARRVSLCRAAKNKKGIAVARKDSCLAYEGKKTSGEKFKLYPATTEKGFSQGLSSAASAAEKKGRGASVLGERGSGVRFCRGEGGGVIGKRGAMETGWWRGRLVRRLKERDLGPDEERGGDEGRGGLKGEGA